MTEQERIIVDEAVDAALAFGLGIMGIMTNVSEQLEMNDLSMTDEIEEYAFNQARRNA
jgi:hypothetical protein